VDLKPSGASIVYLVAGIVLGVGFVLIFFGGQTNLSIAIAALGALLVAGQLILGYRQLQGEDNYRDHEIRLRNEDLFITHSRSLAERTFAPLAEAWVGSPPEANILVRPDAINGGPILRIESLWNWSYGLPHLRAESESKAAGYWAWVDIDCQIYQQAAAEWEKEFRAELENLVSTLLGSGFVPVDGIDKNIPDRTYNMNQIRILVGAMLSSVVVLQPSQVTDAGLGYAGISPPSATPVVVVRNRRDVDPTHVDTLLRTLGGSAALADLWRKLDEAYNRTRKALEDAKPFIRLFADRVQLSGRLLGECDICRPLVPRISPIPTETR
jgi:hypothetical protein